MLESWRLLNSCWAVIYALVCVSSTSMTVYIHTCIHVYVRCVYTMWATNINVLTHTHALFFSTHTTVLHCWQTGTRQSGTEKKSADRHLAKWYIPTHTDTPSTTFLIYKHLSIANCTSICLLRVLCYPHEHSRDTKIVYQDSNVNNSNQFSSHNHRYQENRFISSLKQLSRLILSL